MMANPTSTSLPLMDIHLQSPPSAWPLAWGWWVIIFSAIGLLILIGFMLYQNHQARKALNEAKQQLAHLDSIPAINTLLKRAALSYFTRTEVAPLTGRAWLIFLDQQLPAKHQGFLAIESIWQKGIFSKHQLSDDEISQCKHLANIWLCHALPPKKSKVMENAHV